MAKKTYDLVPMFRKLIDAMTIDACMKSTSSCDVLSEFEASQKCSVKNIWTDGDSVCLMIDDVVYEVQVKLTEM